jgi:hypothetical protein
MYNFEAHASSVSVQVSTACGSVFASGVVTLALFLLCGRFIHEYSTSDSRVWADNENFSLVSFLHYMQSLNAEIFNSFVI